MKHTLREDKVAGRKYRENRELLFVVATYKQKITGIKCRKNWKSKTSWEFKLWTPGRKEKISL